MSVRAGTRRGLLALAATSVAVERRRRVRRRRTRARWTRWKRARDNLVFRRYASVPAALHAIDQQHVYAALDLTSNRPTLYVASAAGAAVARVLDRTTPSIQRCVSSTPIPSPRTTRTASTSSTACSSQRSSDSSPSSRCWRTRRVSWYATMSSSCGGVGHPRAPSPGGGVVHLADGRPDRPLGDPADLAVLRHPRHHLLRRRSLTAAAPAPLRLHLPVAPSGATVTALRDAVYFRAHQHVHPIAVLAIWAAALFVAWLAVARRREASNQSGLSRHLATSAP